MLNFLDSVTVGDLTVLRDDENAQLFHVFANQPVVAVDPEGLPDFLFILYIKDLSDIPDTAEGGGGYVQFRTVLTLSDDRRAQVTAALTELLTHEQAAGKTPFGNPITDTTPVLGQPLWTAGTVDLSTFSVSDTGLVQQATTTAAVDLTGDLGASFVATLDATEAGVFEGAFKAYEAGTHQLPLVITYKLTYAGRITARMTIDAKHSVVHERVWQNATPWRLLNTDFVRYVPLQTATPFTLDALPALRAQFGAVFPMIHPDVVPEAITQAISDSSITVTIDEASTGDATADAANRQALLKLATDLLTDALMPSLTKGPAAPAASSESDTSASSSLLQLDENAAPGTATFHLELNDAMSVVRQAAPNAPLQVLISDPSVLSSCFHTLRLADDFFNDMKVRITTSGVDFSTTGIAKIHVYCRYSQTDDADPLGPRVDRTFDDELTSATDELHWRFDTARTAGGSHKENYEYMAEVYWQQGGAPTVVPWTGTNTRLLMITPPVLGAIKVDGVLTAPPGSVDSARVDLTYRANDGTTYRGAVELTPAAPRATWIESTGEVVPAGTAARPPTYRYAITYRIGPTSITMPEQTAVEDTVEVPTPFGGAATFTLTAQGSFADMTGVSGTLTYSDAAHGYTVVRTFDLTPAAPSSDITVPILIGGPRTATVTARVVNTDGTHEDLAPISAGEGRTWVGSDLTTALVVALHADLLDFAADVRAVQVTLTFHHADGTTTTAEPIFTADSHAAFTWTVPRQTGDPSVYDADITFYGIDRAKDQTVHLTGQSSPSVLLDRSMAPAAPTR